MVTQKSNLSSLTKPFKTIFPNATYDLMWFYNDMMEIIPITTQIKLTYKTELQFTEPMRGVTFEGID